LTAIQSYSFLGHLTQQNIETIAVYMEIYAAYRKNSRKVPMRNMHRTAINRYFIFDVIPPDYQ
jgi:hypothetical protein